jgi:L-lysine exporter family protein LysE/ArgO
MLLGASRATMGPDGWLFLAGVMTASFCWFFGITILLHIFGSKFTPKIIRWINIICGVVIIAYGVKLFVQFILEVVR